MVKGGPRVLPPKYLLVERHKNCLSSHTCCPGDTYKKVCVPEDQPKTCPSESWNKLISLKDMGEIEQCRTGIFIKILHFNISI